MWDTRVKKGKRRLQCSCFVEGSTWTYSEDEAPTDCPERQHCRYYIHFT